MRTHKSTDNMVISISYPLPFPNFKNKKFSESFQFHCSSGRASEATSPTYSRGGYSIQSAVGAKVLRTAGPKQTQLPVWSFANFAQVAATDKQENGSFLP